MTTTAPPNLIIRESFLNDFLKGEFQIYKCNIAEHIGNDYFKIIIIIIIFGKLPDK